mgnify:CR=1 FL=1
MVTGRQSLIYSLLDQLASALSLFAFTAIVSRALAPEMFGYFTVLLAWVSLLGALLQPALIDSSTVLASRTKPGDPDWSRLALQLSFGLMLVASVAAVLFVLSVAPGLAVALLLAIASEVMVSAMALLRRTSYVGGPAWMGASLSSMSLVLTVCLLPAVMQQTNFDGIQAALLGRLLVNGFIALPACWLLIRGDRWHHWRAALIGAKDLIQFSRAYIGGSVIFWITNSLQVVLIGHALSMTEAAGYRAALLLTLPLGQLQAALFQLMLPRTLKAVHAHQPLSTSLVIKLCLIFGLPPMAYAVSLFWLAHPLLGLVFGPSYEVFEYVAVALAGLAIVDALKQVAVILIYALDMKSLFMRYRLWALALFLCGVVPALWIGELMAFVVASGVGSVLLLIYLGWFLSRRLERGVA